MNFNMELLKAVLNTYNIFYTIDVDDTIIIPVNAAAVNIKFQPDYKNKIIKILLDNAENE